MGNCSCYQKLHENQEVSLESKISLRKTEFETFLDIKEPRPDYDQKLDFFFKTHNIYELTPSKESYFHLAAKFRNSKSRQSTLHFLMERTHKDKTLINQVSKSSGYTPMHHLIEQKDIASIRMLVEEGNANLNINPQYQETTTVLFALKRRLIAPLFYEMCLKHNVSFAGWDLHGDNVIHLGISTFRHPHQKPILELLINAFPQNIEKRNKLCQKPLFVAMEEESSVAFELLVSKKANLSNLDGFSDNALHLVMKAMVDKWSAHSETIEKFFEVIEEGTFRKLMQEKNAFSKNPFSLLAEYSFEAASNSDFGLYFGPRLGRVLRMSQDWLSLEEYRVMMGQFERYWKRGVNLERVRPIVRGGMDRLRVCQLLAIRKRFKVGKGSLWFVFSFLEGEFPEGSCVCEV